MKITRRLFLAGIAIACAALPPAADAIQIHGPIAQWYRDPSTTMTLHWIVRGSAPKAAEGKWALGKAGFGYGDNDDATAVAMKGRYPRLYVRKAFDVPAGAKLEGVEILLKIDYDDAFVAFLNGKEIARKDVKRGRGASATGLESHEAGEPVSISVGAAADLLKVGGENIIAIEGHNHEINSSDFSLHPALYLRARGEDRPIIPEGAIWEYYAGGDPDAGWDTATGIDEAPKEPAAKPAPKLENEFAISFRELRSEDDSGWMSGVVKTRAFADTGSIICTADLQKLKPDTEYFAEISSGDSERPAAAIKFRTAPAERPAEFKFVTGGDMYHQRGWLDAMNAQAGEQDPMFALLGGDLAYANGRDEARWYDWVDSWAAKAVSPDKFMVPMVVAIGNHEVDGNGPLPPAKAKFFYSLFALPEGKSNYALDFGDWMSLIQLDSNHTQPVAAQTAWLADALAKRGAVPLKFACYHRPAWGTGTKGNITEIQAQWSPLFEQHGVLAAFENDHHVYKRSRPLKAGAVTDDGVLYLGDGAWGVETRKIPPSASGLNYLAKFASERHLIAATITAGAVKYEAVKADGEVFDSYVQAVVAAK